MRHDTITNATTTDTMTAGINTYVLIDQLSPSVLLSLVVVLFVSGYGDGGIVLGITVAVAFVMLVELLLSGLMIIGTDEFVVQFFDVMLLVEFVLFTGTTLLEFDVLLVVALVLLEV